MAAALALDRPRGVGLQKLSRNLIGARSIEAIQTTVGSTTTAYPLYDLMGNMKATLAKSGSTFSTTNWRQWDAWGELRSSDGTGGPSYGYVANLGHPGDAEGSLTYMRARYYEAASGRFVSEDQAMDGGNWYIYANQSPTSLADDSGNSAVAVRISGVGLVALGSVLINLAGWITVFGKNPATIAQAYSMALTGVFAMALGLALYQGNVMFGIGTAGLGVASQLGFNPLAWAKEVRTIGAIMAGMQSGSYTAASTAVMRMGIYSLTVIAYILAIEFGTDDSITKQLCCL